MPSCPRCGSSLVIKSGHIHNGKSKFACTICKRKFVGSLKWRSVSAETKALIDRLLLERVSLAGIARMTGVSSQWLQTYVNAKCKAQQQVIIVPVRKKMVNRAE